MNRLIGVLFVLFLASQMQATSIYVKPGGTGNGQSWENALGDIQQAINTSGVLSVFVAAGEYQISTPLVLNANIAIYGGFTGLNNDISKRGLSDLDGNGIVESWELTNPSILKGNGAGRILDVTGNHAIIDGFTIRNGKAATGGGVSLTGGAKMINCIIENNTATGNGGGVSLEASTLEKCMVRNNVYSGNGGGVYATGNSIVKECKIEGNSVLTGNVKVGDILEGGIVYEVDYNTRTASLVSLGKASETVWSMASAWCNTYGVGYSLPTSTELQQVYIVKDILNAAISAHTGSLFIGEPYWTSSDTGDKACQVIFDTGYAGNLDKTERLSVRAIKSITF